MTKLLSSGLFAEGGISTLDLHTEVIAYIALRTSALSDNVGHQT